MDADARFSLGSVDWGYVARRRNDVAKKAASGRRRATWKRTSLLSWCRGDRRRRRECRLKCKEEKYGWCACCCYCCCCCLYECHLLKKVTAKKYDIYLCEWCNTSPVWWIMWRRSRNERAREKERYGWLAGWWVRVFDRTSWRACGCTSTEMRATTHRSATYTTDCLGRTCPNCLSFKSTGVSSPLRFFLFVSGVSSLGPDCRQKCAQVATTYAGGTSRILQCCRRRTGVNAAQVTKRGRRAASWSSRQHFRLTPTGRTAHGDGRTHERRAPGKETGLRHPPHVLRARLRPFGPPTIFAVVDSAAAAKRHSTSTTNSPLHSTVNKQTRARTRWTFTWTKVRAFRVSVLVVPVQRPLPGVRDLWWRARIHSRISGHLEIQMSISTERETATTHERGPLLGAHWARQPYYFDGTETRANLSLRQLVRRAAIRYGLPNETRGPPTRANFPTRQLAPK